MKSILKLLALAVIIAGSAFALRSQQISAQEPASISLNVSPTVIELDANRGNVVTGSFKIVNGSNVAVELTPTPKNFTPIDEIGGVSFTEDDTTYSLAKWLAVSPAVASVEPRGSQIFEYTIDVPSDAEPGGHFGSIIVNTQAIRVDQTGPAVVQEVGPLLLVRVPGDTFEEASIVNFESNSSFYGEGPVTLETRVENTGNVHFKPQGTIEIKNTFGRTVTTIDLQEENVLPDSIRRLVNDWSPDGFTLGRYTANLTIVYGINNEIVTAKTSFVVFPYKTIIPITLVVLVVVTFAVRNRDRLRKAASVLKNG